jgi:hypothetical protein
MAHVGTIQKTRLPWKDCECGCHGNTLELGSQRYWSIYWSKDETIELRNGHGLSSGQKLGVFQNAEEMRAFIEADALPKLLKEQDEVQRALALFS